jgi:uncharacterized membrane protein YgcG
VLFSLAWLIRRTVPSQSGTAFPGYFLFLLVASIVPSLFCSRVAFQFMNWRALATSWLFVLAISQFWEGSLGVPYGWWAYEPDQMMGIFLKPHCDLPIEAALVWTLGSWTTVIIYETILTALYAGRRGRSLFGVVRAADAELEGVKRTHLELHAPVQAHTSPDDVGGGGGNGGGGSGGAGGGGSGGSGGGGSGGSAHDPPDTLRLLVSSA